MIKTGVFYASGTKGKTVRADGKGGSMKRGWYCRKSGEGLFGPFRTKTEANIKHTGNPRGIIQ